MLDFGQVLRFQQKLLDASETSDIEAEWKRDTAKDLAENIHPPRDSGALAASVRATNDGVSMLDYWRYPEYGTVHMAPRAFVRPALARRAEPAAADLGKKAIRELT